MRDHAGNSSARVLGIHGQSLLALKSSSTACPATNTGKCARQRPDRDRGIEPLKAHAAAPDHEMTTHPQVHTHPATTPEEESEMDYFAPVHLHGTRVSLEPLLMRHLDDLSAAGADEMIWRWLPSAHHAPGTMKAFIESATALYARRLAFPFATIDHAASKAVGSTRFHCIEPEHRRLEIGVTWIAPAFQRSHVNTEAKLLQLWYAFDVLECRRVEFKADLENQKSRVAILRLGAKEEGTFRKHMLYSTGRNRDSVYFSIIDDEWPRTRRILEAKLGYAVRPQVAESTTES